MSRVKPRSLKKRYPGKYHTHHVWIQPGSYGFPEVFYPDRYCISHSGKPFLCVSGKFHICRNGRGLFPGGRNAYTCYKNNPPVWLSRLNSAGSLHLSLVQPDIQRTSGGSHSGHLSLFCHTCQRRYDTDDRHSSHCNMGTVHNSDERSVHKGS